MKTTALQLSLDIDLTKPINSFMRRHRDDYLKQAKVIIPDTSDPSQVWSRLTFAILSANTSFSQAVQGLQYAVSCYSSKVPLDRFVLIADYLVVEEQIRGFALRHKVGTFVAQWLIWNYRRGSDPDHDIFPGNHKET